MKVAMVTGSYPPAVCGVGDNTYQFVQSLQAAGISVRVITGYLRWDIMNVRKIVREIAEFKPDIVHIQYPTVGYRFGFAPHFLSLLFPSVVTIHEVSQVHVLRRLSLYLFALHARYLIFTTAFERNYAVRYAPWIQNKAVVIPIGNFILPVQNTKAERDMDNIVYFGLIRPDKGLEDLITLGRLIKERNLPFKIRVIGKIDERCRDYFTWLFGLAADLPISWELGLNETLVAKLLGQSRIAYLPFPDGASERRSSLLACLANGTPTITTQGNQTPHDLESAVAFAESPAEALQIIQNLEHDNASWKRLSINGCKYANRFSWDNIVENHVVLYNSIIAKKEGDE